MRWEGHHLQHWRRRQRDETSPLYLFQLNTTNYPHKTSNIDNSDFGNFSAFMKAEPKMDVDKGGILQHHYLASGRY